jgi:hypothetical protein
MYELNQFDVDIRVLVDIIIIIVVVVAAAL